MYVFGFVHVVCKKYREEHPPEADSDISPKWNFYVYSVLVTNNLFC